MSEEQPISTTNTEAPQEPSTILGGGGEPPSADNLAFNPDHLPGELANEPSLRNFDSVEKLAKSYVHAVRKLGAPGEELVRINGETDRDEIYNRLGRPEDPGGYEFDGEVPDHFREASHKIGLSKDQARELVSYMAEQNKQQNESMRENYEKEQVNYQQSLQKEFGDDYNKNVELARRAFLQYGDAETVKFLEESGLGNHPGLIKTFSRIGQSLSEDNALLSGAGENLGGMSPVSAESRLAELRADKDFMQAYNDAYHPKHNDAVKRMTDLYQYMH
mgnify:CR=1 FL=1|tara:strand:+ start:577 stop:1404 length:828 start_codon:yes stop_codon:yes gene_type:complete